MMEATALGNKLFLSLLDRALMAQYLFPDGKGTNKLQPWGVWVLTNVASFLVLTSSINPIQV